MANRKARIMTILAIILGLLLLVGALWSVYCAESLSKDLTATIQRHSETTVTFLDGAQRYGFKKKSINNWVTAWVLDDELIVGRYGEEMAYVWVPTRLADDFVSGLGKYRAQLRGPWRNVDKRGNVIYSFYSNGSYRKLQELAGNLGSLFLRFFSAFALYLFLPALAVAGAVASVSTLPRTSGFDIFHKRPSKT
jgi:hypothetical protein